MFDLMLIKETKRFVVSNIVLIIAMFSSSKHPSSCRRGDLFVLFYI